MTYHPTMVKRAVKGRKRLVKDKIESLADDIKYHLKFNLDLKAITLGHLHKHVNAKAGKHQWEQALHRLNLQGIVSKPKHGKTYCCGECRQDYWLVYGE